MRWAVDRPENGRFTVTGTGLGRSRRPAGCGFTPVAVSMSADLLTAVASSGFEACVADAMSQGLAIVTDEVAQLRALPVPAGDEPTINAIYAIYAKVDDAVKAGRQELDALRAGNTATVERLDAGAKTVQGQANQAAAAYGPTE